MDVVRLSPRETEGANTRRVALYKCEDGKRLHLVWHDRHGWYCEMADHGDRDCPAVKEAQTHEQSLRTK